MINTFTFIQYNKCLQRVIDWNAATRGPNYKFKEQDFKLQRSITEEELNETIDAILAGDQQETLDGIADVFVTAGFLNYMLTNNTDVPVHRLDASGINPLEIIQNLNTDRLFAVGGPSHRDIQKLYAWACDEYGQETVDTYFNSVLASNESKFVPADQWSDDELTIATDKYAFKGFTDIMAVDAIFAGNPVKILRADHGKGKILKPTTFKEPTDFH